MQAVYIGGFGNGQKSADGVAEALADYYGNVVPFTFSSALEFPHILRQAARKADVITHSAGMLALRGTSPNSITAFGAPLPTSKCKLVGRTMVKTGRMHVPGVGIRSPRDVLTVTKYNSSTMTELAVHPIANLGQLGKIACFDAVQAAIAAKKAGISSQLTYNASDEYYRLTSQDTTSAIDAGVIVKMIPGVHDELVLRPKATLQQWAGTR